MFASDVPIAEVLMREVTVSAMYAENPVSAALQSVLASKSWR